ncbi:MAG: FHA domain-containing protein [Eubacterium sp.]|nr:FHA domain-containing protein [Eubacterium sp.]
MIEEEWSDSSGSYIRIRGDEGERIGDRILRKKCIKGILPVEIERVNDRQEYVYETTGYRSLNEYMERTPLCREQWVELWKQVTDTLEDLEMHLMDGEHLVIDGEHLYLQGDRPEVSAIWIPAHKEKISIAVCRLMEQILRYPEADRETSEYIYKLHDLAATKELPSRELYSLLRNEESGVVSADKKYINTDEHKETKDIRSRFLAGVKSYNLKRKGMDCKSEKNDYGTGNRVDETNARKNRLLCIGILALGILIPGVLFKCGIFISSVTGQVNYPMLGSAFLFFIAVAGYGAWSFRPREKNRFVYEDDDAPSVCLIPQVTGLNVLPVMEFPWQIGRDPNLSDAVVDRDDIAPVHARIQRESETVYLVDEEAPAGTFLNNNRIVPWEKNRVIDGDLVTLGATPYVIEISP